MTKQPRIFNRLLSRITSISSIERVTDKLNPRPWHTKTVDEEFEDLVEEFDAIESALRSFIESNEHFVTYFNETLKSSERAASLLRLLTYQELMLSSGQRQEGAPWDHVKSYLAALKEIAFSVNDPFESLSFIVNKKIEALMGLSKNIGEKINFRDKALSNYDKVYEKYDQMTIQTTSQKLSPKELHRYSQLETKMKSLKHEFDSLNSILKLELPTYFILVRNYTEPLVLFFFYTHLTVAYQYKLNLQSIMPHFDPEKTIFEPGFANVLLKQCNKESQDLPEFKMFYNFEKPAVTVCDIGESVNEIEGNLSDSKVITSDSKLNASDPKESTSDSKVTSDFTSDSKVTSDFTSDSKVTSDFTSDSKVTSDFTSDSKVTSDCTSDSKLNTSDSEENVSNSEGNISDCSKNGGYMQEKVGLEAKFSDLEENADDFEGKTLEIQDDIKPLSIPSRKRVEYCRAIFNFSSHNEDDLKFAKGDLIQIIERNGEWWIGQFKGKKGLFPANYVESNDKPAV